MLQKFQKEIEKFDKNEKIVSAEEVDASCRCKNAC
jgi:hypothetical protein